jgi:hypothetical protein
MRISVMHGVAAVALLLTCCGAWAQSGSTNMSTNKPAMQAQELSILVPKDSSQKQPRDVTQERAGNPYNYGKQGVNCSLYPARCRD